MSAKREMATFEYSTRNSSGGCILCVWRWISVVKAFRVEKEDNVDEVS
jgi:hypothetical protein